LIREWEVKLAKRPEHVKRTAAGKVEAMTEKQCKDYMRPFFRRCKRKDVDADILEHIFRIVKLCEEREYLKAGDQYVQLAIGNAPWPMGVTSVGIHERAARTKIFANNIAHVMNDEYQRKYITSIKRLMTQCQEMYPTDPSKMLM
jgi:pre-mRNA-splicing factor 18